MCRRRLRVFAPPFPSWLQIRGQQEVHPSGATQTDYTRKRLKEQDAVPQREAIDAVTVRGVVHVTKVVVEVDMMPPTFANEASKTRGPEKPKKHHIRVKTESSSDMVGSTLTSPVFPPTDPSHFPSLKSAGKWTAGLCY